MRPVQRKQTLFLVASAANAKQNSFIECVSAARSRGRWRERGRWDIRKRREVQTSWSRLTRRYKMSHDVGRVASRTCCFCSIRFESAVFSVDFHPLPSPLVPKPPNAAFISFALSQPPLPAHTYQCHGLFFSRPPFFSLSMYT